MNKHGRRKRDGGSTSVKTTMNASKPVKREYASSDKLDDKRNQRQEFTPQTESASGGDLPQRASTMTPVLLEMLARTQGVARWGLNE
jgi:hypothetical protein